MRLHALGSSHIFLQTDDFTHDFLPDYNATMKFLGGTHNLSNFKIQATKYRYHNML